MNKIKLTKLLQKYAGYSLSDAKHCVNAFLLDEVIKLDTESVSLPISQLLEELSLLNVKHKLDTVHPKAAYMPAIPIFINPLLKIATHTR